MNPAVMVIAVAGAMAAGYLVWKHLENVSAFASDGPGTSGPGTDGVVGSDLGGSSADNASSLPPPSGVAMQYNAAIFAAAQRAGVDPVLMKALAAKETGFNANAINPEKSFTFDGTSYAQYDRGGQAKLVAWIKEGNDPAAIGLNPSLGLMQIRVGNAKKFIPGLDAWDLFDPTVNFEAASYLLAEMVAAGLTLATADMWNVGAGSNWQRGVRNLPYRDQVNDFYQRF